MNLASLPARVGWNGVVRSPRISHPQVSLLEHQSTLATLTSPPVQLPTRPLPSTPLTRPLSRSLCPLPPSTRPSARFCPPSRPLRESLSSPRSSSTPRTRLPVPRLVYPLCRPVLARFGPLWWSGTIWDSRGTLRGRGRGDRAGLEQGQQTRAAGGVARHASLRVLACVPDGGGGVEGRNGCRRELVGRLGREDWPGQVGVDEMSRRQGTTRSVGLA
ncbi:RHTO0S19e02344g1_1 [Rhodotorula toruloides]|uniref:RHTO0S19e02344g1_1 n=2 Tax=Rhodotorula toruloides TaxID=5286 RepID=A0A061BNP3_RHOTO|nr:uncharacterized protein RHTO_03664 [Rhodotorula toruloides NP11]EMS20130.1 hypothetical protein RHTO_03664 [Rhodotorula toruloides NP11]CDR48682.1 RHTO0S19e02344g1_1 [Rhodotorula toruloides]